MPRLPFVVCVPSDRHAGVREEVEGPRRSSVFITKLRCGAVVVVMAADDQILEGGLYEQTRSRCESEREAALVKKKGDQRWLKSQTTSAKSIRPLPL